MSDRCAESLFVESLSGNRKLQIPSVIECRAIPDEKSQIPTPKYSGIVFPFKEDSLSNVRFESKIDILIPEVIMCTDSFSGPRDTPFAQELLFGWIFIGDEC